MYDCTADVLEHKENVWKNLIRIIKELDTRGAIHDYSKLEEPEKDIYDEFTPKLKGLTYGSDEYKECLKQMGIAIQHHYENNRHHPEYFKNGVNGMNLLDLIEMLSDWKAATMRHADGDIRRSLEINKERFHLSEQLQEILLNTIMDLDW